MYERMREYESYKPVFGNPIVTDYEVIMNGEGQVAFLMSRNTALDAMDYRRKFWFNIHKDKIIIGACTFRVAFNGVDPAMIEIARKNRNVLLIEVENEKVVRATPCDFSADIREEDFMELSLA